MGVSFKEQLKALANKTGHKLSNKLEINGDYGDTSTIVGLAKNLESDEGITLSADAEETSGSIYADEPFSMRPTAIPFDDSIVTVTNGNETIKKVNGFSVVKNQLIQNGNFATSGGWSLTKMSRNGNVMTINDASNQQYLEQRIDGDIPIGHKLMVICVINPSIDCNISIGQDANGLSTFPLVSRLPLTANTRNVIMAIGERKTSASNPTYARLRIGCTVADKLNIGDTLTFDFVQLIDLTQMFQSRPEIATGLEGDSGCRWFLRNFPEYTGYVDFNLGVLKSVSNFTYKTSGINLWDEEWEQGGLNNSAGLPVSDLNRIRSKNFIRVPTGATIYGSCNYNMQCYQYDVNRNFISRGNPSYASIRNRSLILDPLCCYIKFSYGASQTPVTTYNNDIQICLKWTETTREQAYHPHTEQEISIDWSFADGEGKSVSGGISDYKDYVLRKNHKRIAVHTFTNSDTITSAGTKIDGKWRFAYKPENALLRPSGDFDIAAVLVDGFIAGTNTDTYYCIDKTVSTAPTSDSIRFYKEDIQTAEDMKAFLVGKTLYYALETEVVTDMDDSERNVIACDDYGLEYIESSTETVPAGFTILYQDNLKRQITNNANAISEIFANIGDLSALTTADKRSIVNAINELKTLNANKIDANVITSQSITLSQIRTMLDGINTNGEHAFFDVSALGASMYLCTIYLDDEKYKIFDLVSGRYAEGPYDGNKLLTMCLVGAEPVATQSQIDHLQTEIDELGGIEKIKDWDQLGDIILSGDSPNYISAGDKIDVNWIKSVNGTTAHGLTVTCTDMQKFIDSVGEAEAKEYYFVYNGSSWTYNEEVVLIADFGISVSGTVQTGEVMTIVTTVDANSYTFVGYDKKTTVNPAVPHNWTLEKTYASNTIAVDAPESLFNLAAGKTLVAGNYKVHAPYYDLSPMIDVYFTIPNNITANGEVLQFPSTANHDVACIPGSEDKYYIPSSIRPAYKNSNTYIAADIPVLYNQTGEWIDISTVDGVTVTPAHMQAANGNNCYAHCNLRQYLNDDSATGAYAATNAFDRPSPYNFQKGFLYGLDPRVRKLILKCKTKFTAGYNNEGYIQNQTYEVEDDVCLLSLKEMSFNVETSEGETMDLYSEYCGNVLTNNPIAARAKYDKAGGTLNNYRWSRTTLITTAVYFRHVTSAGKHSASRAFSAYYFAPAFTIGKASSN